MNNTFRGDSEDQVQIATHTVGGTPAAGQIYTVTIDLKEIAYTATVSDTNDTIASALQALLAASDLGEFKEATWSVTNNIITSTGDAAMPITITTSATGTGTFVSAVTQVAKGHEFWDDPDNWSLSRVPAFECSTPVQANPSASNGGTLTNGTTYFWVITATNALGETVVSNEKSLAITAPNQTANLSWAQVVGATGYKVYRSTTTGTYGATSLLATISSGSTLTYIDTGTATGAGQPPGASTALGDDIYFKDTDTSVKYNIDQSYGVPNSLHVDGSYTGSIGLPVYNTNGYYEYRNRYLKIAPKKIFYGENTPGGPGFAAMDTGSTNATAWTIYSTGSATTQGASALYIQGSNASNSLNVQQGSVGIAVNAGETANFSNGIKVGYSTQPSSDVTLVLGPGCTWSTITQLGGRIDAHSNGTTLTITSGSQGSFYMWGSSTLTTLSMNGGTYIHNSDGTIGSITVGDGATFDKSQDLRPWTATNCTLRNGCTFKDPGGTTTFTNPFFIDGSLDKMNVALGSGFHLQRS